MPRMDISSLRDGRRRERPLEPRFLTDAELAACFERADLVVLPYREIDQSGVLFTALAFGKPLLLSDVGGFPEVARTGAARTFPAGDAMALRDALARAARGPGGAREMGERARAAAHGTYSWARVRAARRSSCTSRLLADGADA